MDFLPTPSNEIPISLLKFFYPQMARKEESFWPWAVDLTCKGRCFHTNEPKTPAVELVCKHCLKIWKFKKYQKNNEISKCQKFNDTSKSRKCLMSSMCFQTFDFCVWMFDFLILNCWVFECSMLLLNLVYIFCLILSNVSILDLFIKGSLDEKLPSYELLKMLKVIDSWSNRFAT